MTVNIVSTRRSLLVGVWTVVLVLAGHAQVPDEAQVVIGPVENVTTLLIGPTSVVLAWVPAPVYLVHDVLGASLDDGPQEYLVSKHEGSSGLDTNTSSTESTNETSSYNRSNQQDDGLLPAGPQNWTCQPLAFFSNFTVAGISDSFQNVTAKDQLHKVTLTENQRNVSFSQGCVASFRVLWKEAGAQSFDSSLSLPSNLRTANITRLKPNTAYTFVVQTTYVSGHTFPSQSALNITTGHGQCTCDVLGAINHLDCVYDRSQRCYCKPEYQGDFCQLCAPGYYRMGSGIAGSCHRCPCETHSSRTSSCHFVQGFLKCERCEVGYTGNLCNTCDRGFYRFNKHCVSCQCHDNVAPTADRICSATTGACIQCLRNTTGFNCERCLPGYVGDAIHFKNCTLKSEVRDHLNLTSSSSISPGIVAAIIVTVFLIILLAAAFLLFRRYYVRERRRALWTVEMKRDGDDVDFNSVHNEDIDDLDYFSKHGAAASSNKYSRLQEDL